jgi:hypothetical protein
MYLKGFIMAIQEIINKARRLKNKIIGKEIIISKSDIINWFGKKYNYSSYLEISSLYMGSCFDQVDEKIYSVKDCLNYYSEEFPKEVFDKTGKPDHNIPFMEYDVHLDRIRNTHSLFDIILVDPYHSFTQSKKDIETALQLVKDNGVIIIHDCNPRDEHMISDIRPAIDANWCGKTHLSFLDFRLNNPQIESSVLDIDLGCGIIRKNYPAFNPLIAEDNLPLEELGKWEYFYNNRKKLLNLLTVNEFLKHYRK